MRRVREFREDFAPRRMERDGVRLRNDGVPLRVVEGTYRLLTPLFGGGVEPRYPDPVTVVRGTEVRGQLRFWWRAIRGWQAKGSLESLFALEAAIFGSAGERGSSPLALVLEILDRGEDKDPYEVKVEVKNGKKKSKVIPKRDVAHPYLAFPLQPELSEANAIIPVTVGVQFRLRLTYPEAVQTGDRSLDLREELEAALWAWETFGGIGARTRRGFGAVKHEEAETPTEPEIGEKLKRYSREGGWPEGVPHLTPKSLVRVVELSWRDVAEKYQRFRQQRSGSNKRGRSLWPEPDQIRRITGRWAPKHPPQNPVEKFPRGQFGLPIIFHFKDKGDPPDTTLRPKNRDRLASPLLFRPLDEKRCVVAVLEGPRVPPEGVVLDTRKERVPVDVFLEAGEVQKLPFLEGQQDPIRAFVDSL